MLELTEVTASYGRSNAVQGVTLRVAEGDRIGLLGRNGAGKSTILKIMAGLLRPVAGHVSWEGAVIDHLSPQRRVREGIALVPEGRGIFPGLTVDDNIRSGAYPKRSCRRRVTQLLDAMYEEYLPLLRGSRPKLAGSLSGGQQQMVAIGRALMSEPRVLLLDEPSLGLAPQAVEALYGVLDVVTDEHRAVVLVEQYVTQALRFCSRAVGLKNGRIAVEGAPEDLAATGLLAELYLGGDVGSQAGDRGPAMAQTNGRDAR